MCYLRSALSPYTAGGDEGTYSGYIPSRLPTPVPTPPRFDGKKGGAKGDVTAVATGGGGGAGAAAIVFAPAVTSTLSGEAAIVAVANNSLEFRSDTFRSCYGGS
jgi:hypothetical protein